MLLVCEVAARARQRFDDVVCDPDISFHRFVRATGTAKNGLAARSAIAIATHSQTGLHR